MSLFTKEMLIHIGIELVIIAGISFYFHKQNNILSSKINELENKIKEYEENNLKFQKQINQLNKKFNVVLTQQTNYQKPTSVNVHSQPTPVVTETLNVSNNLPESETQSPPNEILDNESDDYDDESVEEILDLELEDELKDLI